VKSAKTQGIRTGNWLSQRQAQALLSAPDISALRGLRDRAILAVLLGCGLRRSEVAPLTFTHLQQRDGRWCIVDLIGKHGRVRTAPMPTWVKVAIDAWTSQGGLTEGYVFRSVNRADRVASEALGEKDTISDVPAPNSAVPVAVSLSRFNCCWATLPSKRRNGILARNRI
jgi:integrase